jgi:hypothetical protein
MNPIEGKRIVMKLGERMLKIFHDALNNMSSNKDFPELNTLDRDGVSVNVRKCRDPGTENGAILTAKSSFWLSCSPEYAFNFLKDNSTRFQVINYYKKLKLAYSCIYLMLNFNLAILHNC